MKKYLKVIESSPLFKGLSHDDIERVIKCLSAVKSDYNKNDFILKSGDIIKSIGLVLSGTVSIVKEDFWGNRNIISKILPGGIFAESYACCPGKALRVNVVSDENSSVLFLDVECILTSCPTSCGYHNKIIYNLMSSMAEKNLIMNDKLSHVTERCIKSKLLSYLFSESEKQGCRHFTIPFNRQQLADYLSVDRSAMCSELSRMRRSGIIDFKKNNFFIKREL